MKKKFIQFLSEKIKDMGLSEKAVAELVELGSNGLAENASDEDIKAKVDFVVPFAKAMQSEYTRKVQDAKQSFQQQQNNPNKEGADANGGEGKNGSGDTIPDWFKKIQEGYDKKLTALEDENNRLKATKAKEEREGKIAAKAKELGIPAFLMKHISLAEDADIDKELGDYKQELVNNQLMPADQAGEKGTVEQSMKEAAQEWAKTLPNK